MADWDDIVAAIGLALGGDPGGGRSALIRCWEQTAPSDQAQRCVLAHYLADLEPDLFDEVAWDERALSAYAQVEDEDLVAVGIRHARGLAPSLHLNLGDGYLRQGRVAAARRHLDLGLAAQDALLDDGYGAMVRGGLARLSERIEAAQPAPASSRASPPE